MLCGITIVYTMTQTAGLTQATSMFKLNLLLDYSLNFLRNLIRIQWENELFCNMAVYLKKKFMCVCVCVCVRARCH